MKQSGNVSAVVFYLSVQENVDDGIVQSSTLGKECWDSHGDGSKVCPLIGKDVPGYAGVRHPAHQEGDHHDDHHACHFLLRSLSGFRLLLLGCSLGQEDGAESDTQPIKNTFALVVYSPVGVNVTPEVSSV